MPTPESSPSGSLNGIWDKLIAGIALIAGAAHIGSVTVDTPLPTGTNTVGKIIEAGADPAAVSGVATAPAAAALIAATAALAAGTYRLHSDLGFSGVVGAGKHILLEHRNAADTATIATLALCPAGAALHVEKPRIVLAVNEKIRAIMGVIGVAGEVVQADIRMSLLPA